MMPQSLPRPPRILRHAGLVARVFCCIAHASAATPPEPPPVAKIVFSREPVEQGITFSRKFAAPVVTHPDGTESAGWKIRRGAMPDRSWMRALDCTLTDPRFLNGAMPVVDLEIEFLHQAKSSFEVYAKTRHGLVRSGGLWGASDQWRTLRLSLDNAAFGQPQPTQNDTPYDIRIAAANEDFCIRRLTLRGYDLSQNPDFSRLLQLVEVTAPDRPVFFFSPGETARLNYALNNLSQKPFHGHGVFSVIARDGATLHTATSAVSRAGHGRFDLPYDVPLEGRPFGVYDTHFDLFQTGASNPIISRVGSIGVGSRTQIRRPQPGEFRYGLDVMQGWAHTSPELMAWVEILGADLIRHGLDMNDAEGSRESLRALRDRGLEALAVFDVPKHERLEDFHTAMRKAGDFVAAIASEFKPPYWELGNEPDLPFFFPAGMARYLDGFHPLYSRVKDAHPQTIVMNGGLAYARHRPESPLRVREFFELLDTNRIDRVAYHAHGAGAQAEREAFGRITQIAAEFGKSALPLVDTETGVAARGPSQEQMQAATCVQKFVVAQSGGAPFMIWFRLLFNQPESYGNLYSRREPRPAALAYRALVETLRSYAYDHAIDLGSPDTEAHLFREHHGDGRVLVLWRQTAIPQTVRITTGSPRSTIKSPQILDLFGNATPLSVADEGILEVVVSETPRYLRWHTTTSNDAVRAAPPVLAINGSLAVRPGGLSTPHVMIRNPTQHPLHATLSAEVQGTTLPLNVAPQKTAVDLAPHATASVALTIAAGTPTREIEWPHIWTLYAPLPRTPDLTTLDKAPASLEGVPGVPVGFIDNLIDIHAQTGTLAERSAAVLIGEVISPVDQTVVFGAGADWWMAWQINGQPIFDTLKSGNGSGTRFANHTFKASLRQGTNLVAVLVLSGSQGWRLATGSPTEVQLARNPDSPPDYLLLTLATNKVPLTQMRVAVPRVPTLPHWPIHLLQSPIRRFDAIPPTASFNGDTIENRFVTQPDASLWWKGKSDLSAEVWAGTHDAYLHVVLRVHDEHHRSPASPEAITEGDAINLTLTPLGDSTSPLQWHCADSATGPALIVPISSAAIALPRQPTAQVERLDGTTLYRIAIPLGTLTAADVGSLSLRILDNDWGELKQLLDVPVTATP